MNKVIHKISLFGATSIVIANMIGTGVFTSLGFQLLGFTDPLAILLLWIVGGIIALFGALTYAEIGTVFPRSGGEYHYLSKIYHPSIGFASGFVSALVGFSAPVALAAMALGKYASNVIDVNPTALAITIVLVISLIHSTQMKYGIKFQNVFTTIKVVVIVAFIILGLVSPSHSDGFSFGFSHLTGNAVISNAFAVSLIYVSYAYSGWNAASYLGDEIDNPKRNLPIALIGGTLIVMLLYVGLNFIFLKSTPIDALKGQLEVGFLSAQSILGPTGGKIMAGVISVLLISTISSMVIAGPRVTHSMGKDIESLSFLLQLMVQVSLSMQL